jgi:hypothetical protein
MVQVSVCEDAAAVVRGWGEGETLLRRIRKTKRSQSDDCHREQGPVARDESPGTTAIELKN